MSKRLKEVVSFRSDKLFNGAVNIDWFGTDEDRVVKAARAFVFHGPAYHGVVRPDAATGQGSRIQDTASFAKTIVRRCYGLEDQPFTLAIAGYGTGKSHLGVSLASLLSDPQGPTAAIVLEAIEAADQAIGREVRAVLQEARQPCLVVAINGMRSFDLTTQITQQIVRQVKSRGLDTRPLDDLRPRFKQAASLVRMANQEVIAGLTVACDAGNIDAVLNSLEQQDERVYGKVHDVFAERGMPIAALRGESIRDIIAVSVRQYCGEANPYRTILVLFDEFGRYTEFATLHSQIAGDGVLQDLFEGIQANAGAACFAGFIQYDLNGYLQRVARVAPEHKNEMLRYVTRYQAADRTGLSINLETLIANLLEKRTPEDLGRWFDNSAAAGRSGEIGDRLGRWFPASRNRRIWTDADLFHKVVRKGCWPLSPYSTWFLVHLTATGKHLQERSALALLDETWKRFGESSVPEDGDWSLSPVDFWCDDLQHDLITSEETGQQGSITLAYASVTARHEAQLSMELKQLLRAVVLASKMGLHASDQADAIEALSKLTGLDFSTADSGVRLLKDEYNVIEWDEAFKAFDILGDAVPRTQFLSFIRQRVASTYDEHGKAGLFASKASTWCDLLGDLECDFAEENKITTREWRFQGATTTLDLLPMQMKLASDRWKNAIGVDEPRGTIIYCCVEPSRDSPTIDVDVKRLLRHAAREADVAAFPILVVLVGDPGGNLGQALAEVAVLEQSINEQDRARFGNLISAHKEKMLQTVRSLIEASIKQRRYVTCFNDLEAQRLARAGAELFSRLYTRPLAFPFDGFSTARGNAADSCRELTGDLLLGKLDYDTVMGKPVKVKNRAVTVLKDGWGIFAQNGSVLRRPTHPLVKSLTVKWDDSLASESCRLPVEEALRQLCMPPYGANLASAGLLLGVFVAPRHERLTVVRNGQSCTVPQWVQDSLFRGNFVDLSALHDVELVLIGDESSEWESLLDEWEQAESYFAQVGCLNRSEELKARVPVPPALAFREVHLRERSETAQAQIDAMDQEQNDAFAKIESGLQRHDLSTLTWGAAKLSELCQRMKTEMPLWDEHQITDLQPHVERIRQEVIQRFPEWLARQAPKSDAPNVIGEFKHWMLHQVGGNLKTLRLDSQQEDLQKRVGHLIRNAETAAEARQLTRDVRSWITAHGNAHRAVRVADSRALLEVGKEYTSKLQGMAQRIEMPEIGEVRTQLAEILGRIKDAVEKTVKRASQLWKSKLRTEDDLEAFLLEAESLVSAFENCPNDLRDLLAMRRALRTYSEDHKQLRDDRLTWPEFNSLVEKLRGEAQSIVVEKEVPWPPDEVISEFAKNITKRREQASKAWIEELEAEATSVASMPAADANRLHNRVSNPPPVLTEAHTKCRVKVLKSIETRLDLLKIEWLVEKFKELALPLRKKFLQIVAEDEK